MKWFEKQYSPSSVIFLENVLLSIKVTEKSWEYEFPRLQICFQIESGNSKNTCSCVQWKDFFCFWNIWKVFFESSNNVLHFEGGGEGRLVLRKTKTSNKKSSKSVGWIAKKSVTFCWNVVKWTFWNA